MAVVVLPDLVREAKCNSTTLTQTCFRVFFVSGIASTGTPEEMSMLAQTATDSVTGVSIPAMNSAHPDKPAMYVNGINATAIGGDAYYVVVRYLYQLYPSEFLMSFRGSLKGVRRALDYNGNKVQITTMAPDWVAGTGKLTAQTSASTAAYPGLIEAYYPVGATVFRMIDSSCPMSLNQYAGCTNNAPWLGATTGTVRFDGVTSETQNLQSYRSEYQFTYDSFGHNEIIVQHSLTQPGIPASGITVPTTAGTATTNTQGTGWAAFAGRGPIDFSTIFSSATWTTIASSPGVSFT